MPGELSAATLTAHGWLDPLSVPLLTASPLFTSWLQEGWPCTCPPRITALPGAPAARARNEQGPVPPRTIGVTSLASEKAPQFSATSQAHPSAVDSTKPTVTVAPHSLPHLVPLLLPQLLYPGLSVTEGIPRHQRDGPPSLKSSPLLPCPSSCPGPFPVLLLLLVCPPYLPKTPGNLPEGQEHTSAPQRPPESLWLGS